MARDRRRWGRCGQPFLGCPLLFSNFLKVVDSRTVGNGKGVWYGVITMMGPSSMLQEGGRHGCPLQFWTEGEAPKGSPVEMD